MALEFPTSEASNDTRGELSVRCEVIAVGTELLLGQIVNTNSAWIGERLAEVGIDCHHNTVVGDNPARMLDTIREALDRADAVVVTGGLGPTQDDLTREVIAEVMGVPLARDPDLVERIRSRFSSRGRNMPENNLRQADIPVGATAIAELPGTAPGLLCPMEGGKVIYAVPGVPWELPQMIDGTVLGDLQRRAGIGSLNRTRGLRTWGQSESGLAEDLADEIERLDRSGSSKIERMHQDRTDRSGSIGSIRIERLDRPGSSGSTKRIDQGR